VRIKQPNFSWMLGGLLSLLTLWPLMFELFGPEPKFFLGRVILNLAFSLTLIVCIWSLHNSKAWFKVGIVLAILSVASIPLSTFFPGIGMKIFTVSVTLSFCFLSLAFSLIHISKGTEINLNRLVGAISTYLLLGIAWALFHMLIEILFPGSFSGPEGPIGNTAQDTFQYIYYSFVTLASLGYGDITPIRPLAQTASYLEAVAGQLYIAILIGSLVGMLLNEARNKRDTSSK
jgi:voltage-gated potassium channel